MFRLEVSTGIAEGDAFPGPFSLELSTVLIQETSQTGHQGPEAEDGGGAHQVVMIAAQQVFTVLEEDLDLPADGEDVDDRLGIGIHQGAAPVAGLLWGASRLRRVINTRVGLRLRTRVRTAWM